MAHYAIGDIHGCYQALQHVLDKVGFSPSRDCLWSVGDLINRGPDSLGTMRFFRDLGDSARVVLGNHDLHLLAAIYGEHGLRRKDTLDDILEAPDREELVEWLRHRNLLIHDPDRDLLMVHAGVPHLWTVEDAVSRARELETVIRGSDASAYFREMYGNDPERWDDALTGMPRWRMITNYLTRMRFIAEDGTLDMNTKDTGTDAPEGFLPWFQHPHAGQTRMVFGHWAALQGRTNSDRFIGLDTGCVWGGCLTLMNLDTREKVSIDDACG